MCACVCEIWPPGAKTPTACQKLERCVTHRSYRYRFKISLDQGHGFVKSVAFGPCARTRGLSNTPGGKGNARMHARSLARLLALTCANGESDSERDRVVLGESQAERMWAEYTGRRTSLSLTPPPVTARQEPPCTARRRRGTCAGSTRSVLGSSR